MSSEERLEWLNVTLDLMLTAMFVWNVVESEFYTAWYTDLFNKGISLKG